MSAPIVGALAGNVLRQFRIELDYAHETAYLSYQQGERTADLDCVGLIVHVADDGKVLVSGTSQRGGVPEIAGLQLGDRLMAINGLKVTGLPLSVILSTLSGEIGEVKQLTIRRGKQKSTILASVHRHP